jgi:hypothetical protein
MKSFANEPSFTGLWVISGVALALLVGGFALAVL